MTRRVRCCFVGGFWLVFACFVAAIIKEFFFLAGALFWALVVITITVLCLTGRD